MGTKGHICCKRRIHSNVLFFLLFLYLLFLYFTLYQYLVESTFGLNGFSYCILHVLFIVFYINDYLISDYKYSTVYTEFLARDVFFYNA